jgi:hypothetical protein
MRCVDALTRRVRGWHSAQPFLATLLAMTVACGLLAHERSAQAAPVDAGDGAPRFERLSCITPEQVAAVRSDVHQVVPAFDACRAELDRKLASLALGEEQEQAAFAAILAQSMAPYGSSTSMKLEDLLRDKAMACDNYALLAGYFAREFGITALSFAGFDGGAVGNHAQLFLSHPGGDLLLDPTTGLVARVSYNELLQGKPVPLARLAVFRQHEDAGIDAFARQVASAVVAGRYLPSDLLYYFHSLPDYIAFSEEIVPLWSRPTYDALLRRFPTPAEEPLRRNLEASHAKSH